MLIRRWTGIFAAGDELRLTPHELAMNSAPRWMLGLFGSPRLERIEGSLATGRAVQRHRMALLSLLALAPSQRLSRDKLIAWLWPDSDSDRGRNLLNVALYNLRKTLGDAALLSSGDDLRLNLEVIRVDVVEFEEAREREDHAAAASLYPGPFLDGFFLADAPEFEHWTEHQRRRLEDACAASLETLAAAATDRGDWNGAANGGRRGPHTIPTIPGSRSA